MPYIVIYVEKAEDVRTIVFNDEHGNSQAIVDSGGQGIGFYVETVKEEWTEEKE